MSESTSSNYLRGALGSLTLLIGLPVVPEIGAVYPGGSRAPPYPATLGLAPGFLA